MVFKDLIIIDVRLIKYLFIIFLLYIDNNIPGPNSYKTNPLIGAPIFNSKYQSPSFYSLSQKLNMANSKDSYPGPGSYISFSEFGVLDPNYKKRIKNQTMANKTKDTDETKNEDNDNYEDFKENKEEEEIKPIREDNKKKSIKEETKNEEAKNQEIKKQETKNDGGNKNEETKNEETPKVEQKQKTINDETKNENNNEDDKSDYPFLKEILQY